MIIVEEGKIWFKAELSETDKDTLRPLLTVVSPPPPNPNPNPNPPLTGQLSAPTNFRFTDNPTKASWNATQGATKYILSISLGD